jgi:ATP-dependent Clp protease ATP-binding subunit ClpC
MFDRYNERARRVLFFSRFEASAMGDRSIEPAHLLLGLIRDKRVQHVLANWNVPLGELRRHLEQHGTRGEKISTSVEIPFSDAVKRLLNFTPEEADRLLHRYIEPEHLLLALLRENDSVAAGRLLACGMTLDDARLYIVSHPAADRRTDETYMAGAAVQLAEPHIEAIRRLARELTHAQANSPEGEALVEQIDQELMMLRQLLNDR